MRVDEDRAAGGASAVGDPGDAEGSESGHESKYFTL